MTVRYYLATDIILENSTIANDGNTSGEEAAEAVPEEAVPEEEAPAEEPAAEEEQVEETSEEYVEE